MPTKIEDSSAETKQAIKSVVGFDAEGNLPANVLHRRDTLANLLAIIDAGDGEIAVATDADALVVYKVVGTESVGVAHYRLPNVLSAIFSAVFGPVAVGTDWKTFVLGSSSDPTIVDNSNIVIPASTDGYLLELDFIASTFIFASPDTAADWEIALQSSLDSGVTWTGYLSGTNQYFVKRQSRAGIDPSTVGADLSFRYVGQTTNNPLLLRIAVRHTAATAQTIINTGSSLLRLTPL